MVENYPFASAIKTGSLWKSVMNHMGILSHFFITQQEKKISFCLLAHFLQKCGTTHTQNNNFKMHANNLSGSESYTCLRDH